MNKKIIAGAVAAAIAAAGGGSYLLSPEKEVAGYLYLERGLFGGDGKDQAIEIEYSRGIDNFGAKAEKQYNVKVYVRSWRATEELCSDAVANYKRDPKPVVVGGHSLGGNGAVSLAHCLDKAKVPVAFALIFDPTPFVGCVPSNVKYATSWRRSFPLDLGGGVIKRCNGSKKDIANITLKNSRHTLIDDYPAVHNGGLARIGIALK